MDKNQYDTRYCWLVCDIPVNKRYMCHNCSEMREGKAVIHRSHKCVHDDCEDIRKFDMDINPYTATLGLCVECYKMHFIVYDINDNNRGAVKRYRAVRNAKSARKIYTNPEDP